MELPDLAADAQSFFEQIETTGSDTQSLYEHWWSGGAPEVTPQHVYSQVEYHAQFEAQRLKVAGDTVAISDMLSTYSLRAGEYYLGNDSDVIVMRRKSWNSEFWRWQQGASLESHPMPKSYIRFYFPSATIKADDVTLWRDLADALDSAFIPFQMKHRFGRNYYSDNLVLWIDSRYFVRVQAMLSTLTLPKFAKRCPPTLCSIRGVGLAIDPKDGDSLGWRTCLTLSTTLKKSDLEKIGRVLANNALPFMDPDGFGAAH